MAAVAACGTGLSWDATPGTTQYKVLRAEYRRYTVDLNVPPKLTGDGFSPDAIALPAKAGSGNARRVKIAVAGAYVEIGSTASITFVDRTAKKGTRYNYEIVAVGRTGAESHPSNVATVSAAKASFAELQSAVRRLGGHPQNVLSLTAAARTAWATSPSQSIKLLGQLRSALVPHTGEASAVADARDAIFRLERTARLTAGCRG